MLNFGFATPKRHIPAQNRVFWRILHWCPWRRLGCRWLFEPPKKTNSGVNIVRDIAHARKRNPLSDLNKILHGGRYLWRNHLCKFWWRSVRGLGVAGGQTLPFSIDFDRRPYNTLTHTVRVFDDTDASRQTYILKWVLFVAYRHHQVHLHPVYQVSF